MSASTYTPVRSAKAHQEVARQIEARILAGELRPGAKLPPMAALSESFGVSVPVIREAIMSLQAKQLVDVRHGRGTYVTDRPAPSLLRPFQLIVPLRNDDILSLMQVRALLEVPAAAMAAASRDAGLDAVEEALETMRVCVPAERWDEFFQADARFHLALARRAGNGFLLALLEPIIDLVMTGRPFVFPRSAMSVILPKDVAVSQHERILAAVRAGDEGEASAAMREHLDASRRNATALALEQQRQLVLGQS